MGAFFFFALIALFIIVNFKVCVIISLFVIIIVGMKELLEFIDKKLNEQAKKKYNLQLYVWNLCMDNRLSTLESEKDYKKIEKIIKENNVVNEKIFIETFLSVLNDEELLTKLKNEYKEQKAKRIKERQRKNVAQKMNQQKEYMETATLIYKKCRSLGLKSFKTKEQLRSLKLVASNFGVNDLVTAKKMLQDMQKQEEKQKKEEKQRILNNQYQTEMEIFEKEKSKSRLTGKDRYYYGQSYYDEILKMKLIENINKHEFDKFIKCEAYYYEINGTKTFYVLINVEIKKEIKILKAEGILDGTFKINVLNKDKKIVATGYLNGEGTYPNISGFVKENKVICIPSSKSKINKKEKYIIEVNPKHLWIIEK